MKPLAIILTLLLFVLQYDLWFGEGSLLAQWQIQRDIDKQLADNRFAQVRNDTLAAEVDDLKRGNDAIEERARSELGMIKQHETFVQVVDPPSNTNKSK